MDNAYYTVEQISKMLDMHPKTIQRYIREGKLHAVKIGKGWRVAGHDLSVFTENAAAPQAARTGMDTGVSATASSVVDIRVPLRDEAVRIMNALTAVLNAKPPEFGRSSMQAQFIEEEFKLRVTLWGGARFTAAMLETVAFLTEQNDGDEPK
ncbi:DNA binding domain-containing protein, excisionase family [Sporobacter termitidis DSM 10068]|uniref:DNA binding domain-containing protein, excisionase family n=1 Tax=Sporobacter termitidis DSM 10068 TaxID=1123282 RepID=A0A1M5X3X2_9FIRM|nr:helix-turn-helix domain-containing protein [Sporobacter termitidis]SHH94238.1 DNA binding domain-containing protein, excisionase family [Sporobacter termitidis DSM 10068]